MVPDACITSVGSGSAPHVTSYCSRFQANALAKKELRAMTSRTMGNENDGLSR